MSTVNNDNNNNNKSPDIYDPRAGHHCICEGHGRRLFLKRKLKGRIMKAYVLPGAGGEGSKSSTL